MEIKLSVHQEEWPAAAPFRITGVTWDSFPTIVVELSDGEHVARGEAMGIYYEGENPATMLAQVEQVAERVEAGLTRNGLMNVLPHGGARNAIDCALWDLESKRAGSRVWELVGVELRPITTVMTIGIEDTPEAMAGKAAAAARFPVLKVKLDDVQPVERIEAIRAARPDARLVIDANQGWSFDLLQEVAPRFKDLGVEMIEQPLRRGGDEELDGYDPPLPLCADESCVHQGDLDEATRRYQMINVKLDKCGGLTAGLAIAREARRRGLGLMVGCMGGTSLGMAPAFVVGLLCDFHDVDGPLLIRHDRAFGLVYRNGEVQPPSERLWG